MTGERVPGQLLFDQFDGLVPTAAHVVIHISDGEQSIAVFSGGLLGSGLARAEHESGSHSRGARAAHGVRRRDAGSGGCGYV